MALADAWPRFRREPNTQQLCCPKLRKANFIKHHGFFVSYLLVCTSCIELLLVNKGLVSSEAPACETQRRHETLNPTIAAFVVICKGIRAEHDQFKHGGELLAWCLLVKDAISNINRKEHVRYNDGLRVETFNSGCPLSFPVGFVVFLHTRNGWRREKSDTTSRHKLYES